MHPFRQPTAEEWTAFVDEVERQLGRKIFVTDKDVGELLVIFHGSIQACGEGASPMSFANVIKGRLWLQ